jgi:hypothetical protein
MGDGVSVMLCRGCGWFVFVLSLSDTSWCEGGGVWWLLQLVFCLFGV